MDGRKWKIADVCLGVIGGICGVVGILTGIKSSAYDEQKQYEELEARYGLTPVNEKEEA